MFSYNPTLNYNVQYWDIFNKNTQLIKELEKVTSI